MFVQKDLVHTEVSDSTLDQGAPFQGDFASCCTWPGKSIVDVHPASMTASSEVRNKICSILRSAGAHRIAYVRTAARFLDDRTTCKVAQSQMSINASRLGIDWHSKTQTLLLLEKLTDSLLRAVLVSRVCHVIFVAQ